MGKHTVSFKELMKNMNRTPLVELFGEKIYGKNITLIAGKSLAGKTVTCVRITDKFIEQKRKVLYFDTDGKPIRDRTPPNLLMAFAEKNPKGYQEKFRMEEVLPINSRDFIRMVKKAKPDLIVIDSIYTPFQEAYKYAKERAKKLRSFLLEVRGIIRENNIALVVTTHCGKGSTDDEEDDGNVLNVLGGGGLMHMSDTKWMLRFNKVLKKLDKDGYRKLEVDYQTSTDLFIPFGGDIREVAPEKMHMLMGRKIAVKSVVKQSPNNTVVK